MVVFCWLALFLYVLFVRKLGNSVKHLSSIMRIMQYMTIMLSERVISNLVGSQI